MAASPYIDDVVFEVSDDDDGGSGAGSSLGAARRPSPPPTILEGDRIVFIGDDGMADSAGGDGVYDNVEILTAEFRHRIGLLPEEEQELSEVFKASIGMTAFDYDRMENLARDKRGTMENFAFSKFANKYFHHGINPRYSSQPLRQPVLYMEDEMNKKAAPLIWMAIQRFMEMEKDDPFESERAKVPVMAMVHRLLNPRPSNSSESSAFSSPEVMETKNLGLEAQKSEEEAVTPTTPSKTPERKSKLQKIFRLPSSDKSKKRGSTRTTSVDSAYASTGSPTSPTTGNGSDLNDVNDIPTSELDLVHYVIAFAILKPTLRDEILCQLCCQVTDNPSPQSRERGWMLLALCSGCFLPSTHLLSYYFGFLHDAPWEVTDYSKYIMVMLRRTNANGLRYHPPSWVELQAVRVKKYPVMQVGLPNGRIVSVECDPATTAWEICYNIAQTIGLRDHFGFSIYVGVQRKISSLGAGSDHVMDAISECEQMVRVELGVSEAKSPWRIYYQKEIFTPWHDPGFDKESTNLIYHQTLEGMRRGEYALLPEEIPKMAARIFYIEHGPEVDLNLIKSKMDDYLPKTLTSGVKSRDSIAKSIMTAFETRGYSAGLLNEQQVKNQVVSIATSLWPLNFSAMFEVFRLTGARLASNDVILAVNGEGVFILDNHFKTLIAFHYYDIVDCFSHSSADVKKSTVGFVTLDGTEFSFQYPNSTTVSRIICVYLEGLRRRSRWGVALRPFQLHDYTGGFGPDFRLRQGDIVEMLDESRHPLLHADWLYGRCERTKVDGSFPCDVVYILPTSERPDDQFLNIFRSMDQVTMNTLPLKRSALILSSGTTGRHHVYGLDSSA